MMSPRIVKMDRPAPLSAWDGNPPHADAARARLLQAAARCIARDGLAATSVAAVAAEAGVSRQTVYRYFKGRDELASRAIYTTADALRAQVLVHVAPLSDPADIIVETIVLGLTEVRSDPVLRAIWDSRSLDVLVAQVFTTQPGIEWTRHLLARAVDLAGWNDDEADSGIEFILRIVLSLLVSTSPERNDEELRAFLYRHVIPGLGLGSSDENWA